MNVKMEDDTLVMKKISYLRARDPSIWSLNRPQLAKVKSNLMNEFGEITQQEQEQTKNDDHKLQVYLRIKHGYNFEDLYEITDNILTSKIPPGSNLARNLVDGDSMRKVYTFTKIFGPEAIQGDIFNRVVKPKIFDFINGQNSTLLTYGASGSGKTFTLIGTDTAPGLVPRSLEYLFRTIPNLSENPMAKPSPAGNVTLLNDLDSKKEKLLCRSLLNGSCSSMDRKHHLKTYLAMQQRLSTEPVAELEGEQNVAVGVWVSFAEIYNEHIYDLLQHDLPLGQQRPKLRLGMSNGQTYIKKLTSINVTSGQEAYQIMQFGLHHLNYAATQLNKHSSRSHSIFTIKLVQVCKIDGGSYVSCFNFCDLAGSERSKKTNNVGARLIESNNINNSLLVLGRCLSAVRDLQKSDDHKLVPFRESKLTQLLQKALGGAEDIAMIVNISPSLNMFDETQHVLNFSAVAKELVVDRKPVSIVRKDKTRFSRLVEQGSEDDIFGTVDDYKRALCLLRDELETQQHENELDMRMNLDYARGEYQKSLREQEQRLKDKIKKAENAIKAKYEAMMDNMKLKFERIIDELERKGEVILVESSDDDDAGEETMNDVKLKSLSKSELRVLLREGVDEHRELQKKCKDLERKCRRLEARIVDLENDLENYKCSQGGTTSAEDETDDESSEASQ